MHTVRTLLATIAFALALTGVAEAQGIEKKSLTLAVGGKTALYYLPLTVAEYEEWGNPADVGDYDYILSYSPYDNVDKRDYPAMLVTAGFNDSQVGYFEPAKWVAKLRRMKTDRNVIIFRTNMTAGHSGESGRFGPIEEDALIDAFLIDQAGLTAKAQTANAAE